MTSPRTATSRTADAAGLSGPPPTWSSLWAAVREDLAVDKGDWRRPGFRAVAVHRFGAWVRQQPRGLVRWLLSKAHRVLFRAVRSRYLIELPATAQIGPRLRISHCGPVVLHPFSRIGADCLLMPSTTLGTNREWRRDSAPTLGDRVTVGVGGSVLGPVTVGDDARIGPGAVVFFDVPARARVVVPRPRMIVDGREVTDPPASDDMADR